jgi:hypothetical protein
LDISAFSFSFAGTLLGPVVYVFLSLNFPVLEDVCISEYDGVDEPLVKLGIACWFTLGSSTGEH